MRRDQGSIRERSKGRWEIRVELGLSPAGKRRRKIVQFRGNKTEATRHLRELLTAQDKGLSLDTTKATVEQFLEKWLTDYAETNTGPRTVEGYREKIRGYIVPHFGSVLLVKLTPQHIQSLYSAMLGRGLSPRTVLHTHRILREALSHGLKWDMLMRNVCDSVDPPKPRRREMTALDFPDVQRFLDVAVVSPYGPLFFLAVYTGLRRSELLGLRWSAIDLVHKNMSITETLQLVKGRGLVSLEPKTSRSRRLVSLAPDASALLSGLKIKQREQAEALEMGWSESWYVFCHLDGSPFYPNTVSKRFSELVKKAGVPKLRLHDLRHTHASLMLKEGVNPKTVAERLGHASVVITLDTYSHVLPGLQEEAALKFEEGMRRATNIQKDVSKMSAKPQISVDRLFSESP